MEMLKRNKLLQINVENECEKTSWRRLSKTQSIALPAGNSHSTDPIVLERKTRKWLSNHVRTRVWSNKGLVETKSGRTMVSEWVSILMSSGKGWSKVVENLSQFLFRLGRDGCKR